MEYLLSEKNIRVLESFCLAHTIYGFDFDGTLVPIVDHPDKIIMTEECNTLLQRLSKNVPLAIITGRSVEDISSHISFKPRYIIGNHGIEGIHTESELLSIKEIIQFYRSLIQNQFQDKLEELGILLEDKVYSLSLHYRNSKTPNEAEFFIQTHLNCFASVKLSPGKMVFNLTPNIGINKGQAFISLLKKEQAQFGFYIGDDETDEDVFVYRDPRLLTVRIGFSEKSKAKYYINSQAEICQVLETLCKIY